MVGTSAEAWWNEARTVRLIELHGQGMSSSQIATDLGLTRNAVCGKKHRLGLRSLVPSGTRTDLRQPRIPRRNAGGILANIKARFGEISKPLPKPKHRPLLACDPKTIAELNFSRDCRWPLWNGYGPRFYCGAAKQWPGIDPLHHYCGFHADVAFKREGRDDTADEGDNGRAGGIASIRQTRRNRAASYRKVAAEGADATVAAVVVEPVQDHDHQADSGGLLQGSSASIGSGGEGLQDRAAANDSGLSLSADRG